MKKIGMLWVLVLSIQLSQAQNPIVVEKSGQGAPILFLPGFTSPGSVWNGTISNLDGQYETHQVSYAGFNGLAPIPTPWYSPIKDALIEYVKNNKLKNLTVVGHSMGGNLAIELAAGLPEQVVGVVLVESIPCMRELMMPGVAANTLQYDSPYNNRILNMEAKEFEQMANGMAQNMTNQMDKVPMLAQWSIEADRKTYVYGYTDLLKLDLRPTLAGLKQNVLILGADFPNKQMVQSNYDKQYSNLKNKSIYLADGSRHFIMLDQPQWMHTKINNYLNANAQ